MKLQKLKLISLASLLLIAVGCGRSVPSQKSAAISDSDHSNFSSSLSFRSDDSPVLQYEEPSSVPAVSVDESAGEITLAPEPETSTGSFSLAVTDAPSSGVEAIWVHFTGAEVMSLREPQVYSLLDTPVEVDLLQLQDGLSQLFGQVTLPEGTYHNLRFYIDEVAVSISGNRVNVAIPDWLATRGLKIFGRFKVKAGSSVNAIIDFDVERLLVRAELGILLFRPYAKLRHVRIKPAGIHLEEAADGTLSLIGPTKSVRPNVYLQVTNVDGSEVQLRANSDGSFRFDDIPRTYGKIELAVVEPRGKGPGNGNGQGGDFWDWLWDLLGWPRDHDDSDLDGNTTWKKIAWVEFQFDFVADDKYPAIRASHLERLLGEVWESADSDVDAFMNSFQSDPFRYLAGLYVQSKGLDLPAGFEFPDLGVPYSFELEGPDYQLPGYTFSTNDVNFIKSESAGCLDAEKVFGSDGTAEEAIREMIGNEMPFTGLLAEYHAVCRSENLAELSCGTLGSLAVAGSYSLPAITPEQLAMEFNSPRGGMIARLLSCVGAGDAPALPEVAVPTLSSDAFACAYGCASEEGQYLNESQLLVPGDAEALLAGVYELDSLVMAAQEAGVSPLALAASYVADTASTKVHGFADRSEPKIFNVLPVSGSIVTVDSVDVSALIDDRTTVSVQVNGVDADLSLGADGLTHAAPVSVPLIEGENPITLSAVDAAGNVGQYALLILADLPDENPGEEDPGEEEPGDGEPGDGEVDPGEVTGVDALCMQGEFVPKAEVKLGLSIESDNGSYDTIVSGFQSLGYPPVYYSDDDIAQGKPIQDGITVLAISRKVLLSPVTEDYIAGIYEYIRSGGSLMGEYEGAALFFNEFAGTNGIIPNLTPPLALFDGKVEGGGGLIPISNSTIFNSDPEHPIMAGVPSSFLNGIRVAFAVSNYNDNWLHATATFTSSGLQGLVPVGTFPAVLSGRCGAGRVVLFTTSHFQVLNQTPVNTMVGNAIRWAVGQ